MVHQTKQVLSLEEDAFFVCDRLPLMTFHLVWFVQNISAKLYIILMVEHPFQVGLCPAQRVEVKDPDGDIFVTEAQEAEQRMYVHTRTH